jgi:Na+-driven multidrug efflux pump
VFNFSSYVFLSVGLATNTLVGRYIRQGASPPRLRRRRPSSCRAPPFRLTALPPARVVAGRPDESGRVVSQALMFAVTAGTIVGGLIYTLGPQLIALTGVSAAVAEPALGYLRVRALSVPLVVSIVALQSGLLAQKNSTLPGLSVVTAAAVNTVLDVVLIRQCGMGVVGAAVATVIGQVIMFALLLPPYLRRAFPPQPPLRRPPLPVAHICAAAIVLGHRCPLTVDGEEQLREA